MSVMNQYLLAAMLAFFLGLALWPGFLWLAGVFAAGFIAEFLRDLGKML
ncbi:MAG: hypothetical protein JXR43_07820 [Burkholderiaceae bacterium]|nr:hypothetical protein [Burkholderiaceae bacterium]